MATVEIETVPYVQETTLTETMAETSIAHATTIVMQVPIPATGITETEIVPQRIEATIQTHLRTMREEMNSTERTTGLQITTTAATILATAKDREITVSVGTVDTTITTPPGDRMEQKLCSILQM